MSSISNIKALFPGMSPGKPLSPYARWDGTVILARSPMDNCATPKSRPGMTCSAPNLNLNGLFRSPTIPSRTILKESRVVHRDGVSRTGVVYAVPCGENLNFYISRHLLYFSNTNLLYISAGCWPKMLGISPAGVLKKTSCKTRTLILFEINGRIGIGGECLKS